MIYFYKKVEVVVLDIKFKFNQIFRCVVIGAAASWEERYWWFLYLCILHKCASCIELFKCSACHSHSLGGSIIKSNILVVIIIC